MKKNNLLLIIVLFLLAVLPLTLSFVSALDTETVKSNWFVSPFVEFLQSVGWTTYNTTVILLGILLYMVIYSIVKQIFGKGSLSHFAWIYPTVISLIIVILAFIVLPANFVNAIVLQYGVMGATILTVIPFIIVLFFSVWVSNNLMIARLTWIVYIVYYATIYIYKVWSLTGVSGWDAWLSGQVIPYLGAIIIGCFVMWFIPAIRNFAFMGEKQAIKEMGLEVANRAELLHQLQGEELDKSYKIKRK
ncbi:MAG TPA: hypothetical protein P5277_03860 [Candidatus Paceibacterota bacterium]|nr:hypothetical protein [Candidatus Paceibacterota bacterium]